MKRTILLLFAIGLIFSGCTTSDNEEVKIGVLLPLTGEGSFWGQNAQKGIDLALEEINNMDTKYTYKLIREDSQTDPATAVSAFNKLINVDNIKYSIVDMISGNVLAIAPIAEREQVVIISPGASSPKITNAGDFVFRNWPSDALQGEENARIASEVLGWDKVAILKINNEYGQGLSEVFKQEGQREFEIVAEEAYEQGSTNFRTQLQNIREAEPDGVYVLAYPQEIPIIFKQKLELGIEVEFLGTETFETQAILETAGEAAEGSIYTFPMSPDTSKAVVANFRNNFYEKYGEQFGTPADAAYDALHMLVQSIEEVGISPINVKDRLYDFDQYQGASGLYSIDEKGDAIKEFDIKVIKNNTFIKYNVSN